MNNKCFNFPWFCIGYKLIFMHYVGHTDASSIGLPIISRINYIQIGSAPANYLVRAVIFFGNIQIGCIYIKLYVFELKLNMIVSIWKPWDSP